MLFTAVVQPDADDVKLSLYHVSCRRVLNQPTVCVKLKAVIVLLLERMKITTVMIIMTMIRVVMIRMMMVTTKMLMMKLHEFRKEKKEEKKELVGHWILTPCHQHRVIISGRW